MKTLLLTVLIPFILQGTEFAVIANKNLHIESLSISQIKMIFLKKHKILNDVDLVPINLDSTNAVRDSFEKNILDMSRTRLNSFWTKEHYLGQRPPLIVKSVKSVISFVKKIDGAIGYAPLSDTDGSVNIIYKWVE